MIYGRITASQQCQKKTADCEPNLITFNTHFKCLFENNSAEPE